ncbi:MAG: ATP-binding protein [Armatimonadetes bacterium]|nr:ATP-binding protein [Armatimonadota bacterium]
MTRHREAGMGSLPKVPTRLRLDLAADAEIVRDIRCQLEEFIAPLPLSIDEVEGLEVALSEACNNAICHGSPLGRTNRIRVECWLDHDLLVLEVEDEGGSVPRTALRRGPPDDWQTSGRGLYLMRQFTDALVFKVNDAGLVVRMVKRIPHSGSQPIEHINGEFYHASA